MNEKFGVVETDCRSWASAVSGDVVARAGGAARHRLEVHERVLAGLVDIARRRRGRVGLVERRVRARRGHPLFVALPGQALAFELVGDCRHPRREDAALPVVDAVRVHEPVVAADLGRAREELRERRTVHLRPRAEDRADREARVSEVRRLAAYGGDPVSKADVRYAVVVGEERALDGSVFAR